MLDRERHWRALRGVVSNRRAHQVTDSESRANLYRIRGASGHTYSFTRQPNGTTDIDVVVVREGKNLKGRVLGFVLGTIGRRVWKRPLKTPSRPSKPGTRVSTWPLAIPASQPQQEGYYQPKTAVTTVNLNPYLDDLHVG